MATGASTVHLTELHMLVLVALAAHGAADAEEVAGWLGLPVTLVEALCDELEAAGRLTLARGHREGRRTEVSQRCPSPRKESLECAGEWARCVALRPQKTGRNQLTSRTAAH